MARLPFLAFIGGLLLWAAVGVRETFIIYVLAAFYVAFNGGHRKLVLWYMLAGLAVGGLLEFAYLDYAYGDPLIRIRYFLGLNEHLIEIGKIDWIGDGTISGYLLRYAKMLHYTGSAEFIIFALGSLGSLFWLARLRDPLNKIRLVLLVSSYAFIALLFSSWKPLVPYMETLPRYYVSCAPFFYMAAADLAMRGYSALGRIKFIAPKIALAMLIIPLLTLMGWNFSAAWSLPNLYINGFNAYGSIAKAVDEDMEQNSRSKLIYSGGGLEVIRPLYFSPDDDWMVGAKDFKFNKMGYYIASFRSLNQSGGEGFTHTNMIEEYPLLFRHRVAKDFSDIYLVGPQKLQRTRLDVSNRIASGWVQSAHQEKPAVVSKDGWLIKHRQGIISPSDSASQLPGERFVQVRFKVRTAARLALTEAYLHNGLRKEVAPLFLGRLFLERTAGSWKNAVLTNYLPKGLDGFQLEIRSGRDKIEIKDIRLSLLDRVAQDALKQDGGAW